MKNMRAKFCIIGIFIIFFIFITTHISLNKDIEILYTTENQSLKILNTINNQIVLEEINWKQSESRDLYFEKNNKYKASKWKSIDETRVYKSEESYSSDYYLSLCTSESGNNIIYKKDNMGGKQTLLSWSSYPPISFLKPLYGDKYLLFYPEENETSYIYWIKVIDVSTKTCNIVQRKEYDWTKEIGTMVNTVSASSDGKIFSFEIDYCDGTISHNIREYDENGKLYSETSLDLEEFMDLTDELGTEIIDSVVNMKDYGNNLILKTKHRRYLFFAKSDNRLRLEPIKSELTEPLEYNCNLNVAHTSYGDFLTFYNNKNEVIFYDLTSNEISYHHLELSNELSNMELESCMFDGKILYCVLSNMGENAKQYTSLLVKYYI